MFRGINHQPKFLTMLLLFLGGHWLLLLLFPPIIPGLIALLTLLILGYFFPGLLLLFALIAGMLNGTRWYNPPLNEREIGHYQLSKPITLSGIVKTVHNNRFSQQLTLEIDHLYTPNSKLNIGGVVTLKNRTKKRLSPGAKIVCRTELMQPPEQQNYGGFDRRFFLKKQKIYYHGEIKKGIDLRIISPKDHRPLLTRFKAAIKTKISSNLGDTPSGALFKAIFLGDKRNLDPDLKDQLKRVGITHLFAISGFHIGILYLIILLLLKPLEYLPVAVHRKLNIKAITIAVPLPLLLGYLWLIDLQVSALRAWLMITGFVVVKLLQRRTHPVSILAVAALIILLITPQSGYDIGFYLSFLAVTAIILVVKPIDRWLNQFFNNKIARWGFNYLILNGAIFLITAPVLLFTFHTISLTQFWANLIFIPLFSFIIYPGGLLVMLFQITPLQELLYTTFTRVVNLWDQYSVMLLQPINTLQLLIMMLTLLLLLTGIFRRKKNYLFSPILLFTLPLLATPHTPAIYFLSVGNGDAILINHAPGRGFLIDGGPRRKMQSGRYIITPHLNYLGIKTLDFALLTHQDEDHYGGLPYLVKNGRIKKIITNKPLQKPLNHLKIPVELIKKTTVMRINNIKLTLYPEEHGGDRNNNSIISLLEINNKKLLLTGDAEGKREKIWLKKVADHDVDLLKAGHHGSRNGSTHHFLSKIRPEITIISAGFKNRFGHPHKATLKRLKSINSTIYRTDRCGEIVIDLSKKILIPEQPFCNGDLF